MPNVIIYTTKTCPYCIKAKRLLESKDIAYQENSIEESRELAEEAVRKSGGRKTVPQIFIDDYHVGGCDELYALNQEGKLDKLLNP